MLPSSVWLLCGRFSSINCVNIQHIVNFHQISTIHSVTLMSMEDCKGILHAITDILNSEFVNYYRLASHGNGSITLFRYIKYGSMVM